MPLKHYGILKGKAIEVRPGAGRVVEQGRHHRRQIQVGPQCSNDVGRPRRAAPTIVRKPVIPLDQAVCLA
jgi:hypothetical protein